MNVVAADPPAAGRRRPLTGMFTPRIERSTKRGGPTVAVLVT
jgi:hypothetical protein